jgi:hypothetical protein
MIVGDGVTVRRDEEARSLAGHIAARLWLGKIVTIRPTKKTPRLSLRSIAIPSAKALAVIAKAAAEEILERSASWRCILTEAARCPAGIHQDFEGNDRGFHFVDDVGKARRMLRRLRIGRRNQGWTRLRPHTEFANTRGAEAEEDGEK